MREDSSPKTPQGPSLVGSIPISFSTPIPIPTPTPILSAFLCRSLSAKTQITGREPLGSRYGGFVCWMVCLCLFYQLVWHSSEIIGSWHELCNMLDFCRCEIEIGRDS